MSDELNCQLSAFVDDELTPEESELLVRRLCRDESLRRTAACYAIIGDAVRGDAAVTAPGDFAGRVMMAVEGQPVSRSPVLPDKTGKSRVNWGVAVAASVVLAVIALTTLPNRTPEQAPLTIADTQSPADTQGPAIEAESAAPVVVTTVLDTPVTRSMPPFSGTPSDFNVPTIIPLDRQSAANRARLNQYMLRHASSVDAYRQGQFSFRNIGVTQPEARR